MMDLSTLRTVLITACVFLLSGCASRYVYPDPEVPRGEAAGSALSGRADAELARRYKKHIVQRLRELEPEIVRLSSKNQ